VRQGDIRPASLLLKPLPERTWMLYLLQAASENHCDRCSIG